jgi:hypothetical protein
MLSLVLVARIFEKVAQYDSNLDLVASASVSQPEFRKPSLGVPWEEVE